MTSQLPRFLFRPPACNSHTPFNHAESPANNELRPLCSCRLRITADTRGGSMTVSAISSEGRVVAKSRPIVDNVTDGLVKWTDSSPITELAGRRLALRFEFNNARLYSFLR
jgi:hypothetical protein